MECDRCTDKPKRDTIHDHCNVCSKNLCNYCMKNGCCGNVPALSGQGRDYSPTLEDWINTDFYTIPDSLEKHLGKKILKEFTNKPFPSYQKYKGIEGWVLLEDGSAVAMNSNESRGIGFPRTAKGRVLKIYPEFKEKYNL